ncbi:hypothetical protein RIF29_10719 [Crotalaria pallida]|uniref:Uncharacterized protein n=1 Tax=Crotalaria pallida TaxID=3830 RepID=A0AAN9IKV1_CROPI
MSRAAETPAEAQARILTAVKNIVDCGFNAAIFDLALINQAGHTVDSFLKWIKPITSLQDKHDIGAVLCLGYTRGFWDFHPSCCLDIFCRFVAWLRSYEGKEVIDAMKKRRRLEKEAFGALTSEEEASIKLFKNQIADYSNACKGIEEKYKVMKSVAAESYEYYDLVELTNGTKPMAKNEAGMKKATEMFGNRFLERHKVQFIGDGDNRQMLVDYCRENVVRLRRVGEKYKADSLWSLLVACAGEQVMDEAPKFRFGVGDEVDSDGNSEEVPKGTKPRRFVKRKQPA